MIDPIIGTDRLIVCSGGFHGNEELLRMADAKKYEVNKYGMGTSMGTSNIHRILRRLGAKAILLDKIQFSPCGVFRPEMGIEKDKNFDLHVINEISREFGGFLTNIDGSLIVSETNTENSISKTILERHLVSSFTDENNKFKNLPFALSNFIINQKIFDLISSEKYISYFGEILNFFQKYENSQHLCSSLNMNPTVFNETVSQLNKYKNQSSRSYYDKDQPFYRVLVTPVINTTLGGFAIDENCQPIWNMNAKRNIFCAGSVSCGVNGVNILSGNSLLQSIVFGRIAGRNAVLGVPRKEKQKTNEKKEK